MTDELRVTGLDHVVLNVADVERSLAFYCDELGLAPERVDEWRRGEVLFPSVRVDAHTIDYRFTVEDPTTWSRPWTVAYPMVKSTDPVYEYACHEGNYGLANILSAARVEERAGGRATP